MDAIGYKYFAPIIEREEGYPTPLHSSLFREGHLHSQDVVVYSVYNDIKVVPLSNSCYTGNTNE